ncbi:MAG: helix-turn-helix transcriptional regulator [Candidatus Gastranaerophilales bacterium]|nr:helix-turn-helix transcriptional regulator [Candidatus Gastranaerophilales bacterium]
MKQSLILLGKRIAYLRNKKGFTQEKLAEKTHYSTNHISKLELARTNPSFDLLVKIANSLDVELNELFDFSKEKDLKYIKNEIQKILDSNNKDEILLLYSIYSSFN